MSHKDHPNRNPLNTGTRRITLVGIAGPDEGEGIARTTNGGLDVNIQDQFTPLIIARFHQNTNVTTTTAELTIDDRVVSVADATGMIAGDEFVIFNATSNRFYTSRIVSINVNDVTVDTPLDFAYPSGSDIDSGSGNMAVDGSVTPQIFGLRTSTPSPISATADITRVLLFAETTGPNDLSTFADIAGGIVNGLLLRVSNTIVSNIFNVKSNADIAGIAFDFEIFLATNPIQGQHGFTARITFAGQSKMGVTTRIGPGEDLQFIVQDPLQTIISLRAVAEGHIVE